jgi:hypothetical protein
MLLLFFKIINYYWLRSLLLDRLCGLVVRVLDLTIDPEARVRFRALPVKVVGLERGPLSLVSTTEELLDRKSSGSCLEKREYGRRDPSC